MDFDISVLVAQDGITSGAIYAMMALGMVLVFNATRIIFVPFGDLAAYAALTLGYFQLHQRPGTIWFVAVLAIAAWALEVVTLFWSGAPHRFWRATLLWLVVPLVPVGLAAITANVDLPPFVYLVLSVLLVLPIGPLLYRLVYQPIANASILLLLTVSVALHFALSGLALLCFGPEGLRTRSFLKGDFDVGGILVSGQMLTMVAAAALLSVVLYVFFDWTIAGKALRATAMNREGARLVGIRTTAAGATAFLLASAISALAGILISPTTTFYYDSGFMIGLKGFVGAAVGGFVGYPAAVIGALIIGLIESISSFYASALKEAIVFASIIPIVLWRWLAAGRASSIDEAGEE
jgi:branched-chain amino acid transport system permease protein